MNVHDYTKSKFNEYNLSNGLIKVKGQLNNIPIAKWFDRSALPGFYTAEYI